MDKLRRRLNLKVIINSNRELVSEIRAKLRENDNYCPCAIYKTPEYKCMCAEFREKIEKREPGECGCGLYKIVLDDEA